MKRCTRCDIPLGSRPCPNPLCQEPHGQSAGDLCAWCRHNTQETLHGIDSTRLHNSALAVLQEASARVGGIACTPIGGMLSAHRGLHLSPSAPPLSAQ